MPRNMDQLVEKIQEEAEAPEQNPDPVRRAVRDMTRRAQLCIERLGRHVKKTFYYFCFVFFVVFLVLKDFI